MKNNFLNKFLKNPYRIIVYLADKNILDWVPDKTYLKLIYRAFTKKKLNLKNPKTYNEKLQWLKINNRNPLYTKLVDKYEVRKYISEKIGSEYIIPLLGVYDNFEDIEFNKLPNRFVLKTTHDSGGVVVCNNKNEFNIDIAREKINSSLKRNYYKRWREWPYKDIHPKIICEEFICTKEDVLPVDYKFHCFNGEPDNVMVCIGRETGKPKFYFFDKEWNLLKYNIAGKNAPDNFSLEKPKMMDEMFDIARRLSKDLLFVRVDLYCEDNKIYFGELTFFPDSGFDSNLLDETDLLFGEKIKLGRVI